MWQSEFSTFYLSLCNGVGDRPVNRTEHVVETELVAELHLSEGVPEFCETKAAEVFDIGCGKVGDTVMP